ncbi:Piwi domain-containing protein [Aphelenchoides besseyi]|nr:Piwi domain-containing protein [Aphelenchoides besseyi]
MNVKCFGLNYMPIFDDEIKDLSPENKDLLIIGYDIATPPMATPLVGVCANRLKNNGFAGDFFYQQCKNDLVSPKLLELAVQRATETACANGRRPTRILVLRDGVSEGRQQNVVEQELPAIRSGVFAGIKRTAESANFRPKITLVIATKEHIKRFFREPEPNRTLYNTCPGDIISGKVTRTDVPEFFAQAHHPLKGSPKIPQYAVVANELNIPLQKLERAMILLSNMHQVCACPTSLPLPVYLAHETAKRGMEIFKTFEREGMMREITKNQLGIWDFKALTQVLAYYGSPLYGTRFNA